MPIGPINELSDPRFRGSGLADAIDACAAADERAATFLYCASHSGQYPDPPLVAPQLVSGTIDLQISDGSIVPVREYSPLWNQATIYTYVGAPEKLRGYFDELRLLVNAVSGSYDNTERVPPASSATVTIATTGHLEPINGSTETQNITGTKQWRGAPVLSVSGTSGVPVDDVAFSGGIGPTLYNWRALPELIIAFSGIDPVMMSGGRYEGSDYATNTSDSMVLAANVLFIPDDEGCYRYCTAVQHTRVDAQVYVYNPERTSGIISFAVLLSMIPGSVSSFVFPDPMFSPWADFSHYASMRGIAYDGATGDYILDVSDETPYVNVSTVGHSLADVGYHAATAYALSGAMNVPINPGQLIVISLQCFIDRTLRASFAQYGYRSNMIDNVSWMATDSAWRTSVSAMSGMFPVVFAGNLVGSCYDDSQIAITEY